MAAGGNRTSRTPGEIFRGNWLPGVTLSVLAIALRILVAAKREGIEIDGIIYLQNAQALLTNWRSINVLHPPLYPLLLAPVLGLWHDPEWGARVVSAVLGGLWIWPTLWLARETTDEAVSWTAGLLVALMPAAVEASTKVLSEATFGLCLTIFLVFLVHSLRTGSWVSAGFTGILGGLASLARPEGMGYLFLAWGLLVLAPVCFGRLWTRRVVLTRLAVITLCWLAVMYPYMVLVRAQSGHWHWSGKAGISLLFAESVGDERQGSFGERHLAEVQEKDIPKSLFEYVMARPGMILRRMIINLHLIDKYVLTALLTSGGIVLVVLGLAHLHFRRPPSRPEWLLVVVPLPLSGFLLYLVGARYFVALIPVLSIIAGIGLSRIGRQEGLRISRRLSMPSCLLLIVVLVSFVPWIIRPWFRQDPYAIEKAAGLWLRRTVGPKTVFIGSYAVLGYYADSRGIMFGNRSLEDLLAAGRQAGARFLIADNFRLPESRPDLMALAAGGQQVRPYLEMIHVVEDRAGRRILIYYIQ
jgi:4-amino-4-deoxy-L-arabinose transferase-like glycosyltransferase